MESHGLGLNICKKIAKSLGGDLILNEDYKEGCEFIFTLTLDLIDDRSDLKLSPIKGPKS